MNKKEYIALFDETAGLMAMEGATKEDIKGMAERTGCTLSEVRAASAALTVAAGVLGARLELTPPEVAAMVTKAINDPKKGKAN